MTTVEAVYEIAGMRQKGLSDRQVSSWCGMLDDFDPDLVVKTARKIVKGWTEGFDWPIGLLLQRIPGSVANTGFSGFAWDVFTGRARGDWRKFFALDDDERLSIALEVLSFAGVRPILHEETAERMWPGVAKVRDDLAEAKAAKVAMEAGGMA